MRYREIKGGLTRAELEAHNDKIAQIKRNIEADEKGALIPRNTIAAWAEKNPYALDAHIEREFAKRELNRRKMPIPMPWISLKATEITGSP
jgi:hypothetical protein